MTKAQVGCYLFNELKQMGVTFPDNCQEITILVHHPEEPVYILVKGSAWDIQLRKDVFYIENHSGDCITGKMFYELVKDKMQLPDETTGFKIVIKPDEIVTTLIQTATPSGSLDFLGACRIVSRPSRIKNTVKKALEPFKTKRAHAT